ncbi:coiled-coil domain-containing protein [Adhaeretor mobilis]|uniref:Uncharacterized protein n=1 Tax=Adhaeretor mobilis TaxID=1930276 RepID=A0A517MUB5_9BACT|nr:hypothetical protein [Adhaeretor mobilis]QDS98473.1 hypothetical protein HG15A2_17530 [Adhaeretor mobilis]
MNAKEPSRSHYCGTSSPRWLVGSIALHVCLLLVILFLLRPRSERQITKANSPSVTSVERMEQLSNKVRELKARELNRTVESLEDTLVEIEELASAKTQELREAYPEQTESAADDLTAEHQRALQAQQDANEKLEKAIAAAEADDSQQLTESRDEAIEEQLTAEKALAEMATAQVLAGGPTEAIEQLIELQVNASQQLAAARLNAQEVAAAREGIRQTEGQVTHRQQSIERRQEQLQSIAKELEQRRQELLAAETRIETVKKAQESQTEKLADANAAHQAAGQAVEQTRENVQAAQAKLQEARQGGVKSQQVAAQHALSAALQNEKTKLRQQQNGRTNIAKQQHQAKVAENAIKTAEHRAEVARRRISLSEKRLKETETALANEQRKAVPQESEIHRQRALISTAGEQSKKKLADAIAAQQQAIAASQAFELTAPPASTAATTNLATTQEAFQLARDLERKVAERFKDIRAAELALVQQMTPSEARQMVSVALPERADLDEASLDQNARTQAAMQRNLDALTQANQQAQTMDDFAKSLLAQALGVQQEGLEISLADRQQDAARENNQSAEEQGGAVSDMTAVMAKRSGRQGAESPSPPAQLAGAGGADSPAKIKSTTIGAAQQEAPPSPRDMARAVPARRFSGEGGVPSSGWTYVDTWYILGPFDNAGRANIHKQFPPESLVDLDAKYRSSASDALIGWEFYQSTKAKIAPRHLQSDYVIYYAWTELHFESATDAWIAVGSDDRSDLWINDIRVWSSSDTLKVWRIDEGMRRVRFQAGLNKILYRVENGQGPWAFSLCVSLDQQAAVQPVTSKTN